MQLKTTILVSIFVVNFSVYSILIAGDVPYYQINGFGTDTEGGLPGNVIKVTNLNNYGQGSFRTACEDSGKRLVVFEVGGVIDLELSNIIISNPYLTVAGHTAPKPGITLIKGNLNIRTHDVVIQHIAVRPGDKTVDTDAISTGVAGSDVYNVVFDHCSATWATDENLSMINTTNNHDITLYKCLIAEGLNFNDHSCGSLIYGNIRNLAIIGCLYAHNIRRNPRINNNTEFVLVNNIFYNWGVFSDDSGDHANCVHLRQARGAVVGNLALGGNDTRDSGTGLYFVRGHDGRYTGEAYFEDNLLKHADGQTIISENDSLITRLAIKPLWPEGLIPKTITESAENILRTVGSRPGERNATDARIINSVIQQTGSIINRQSDVEGYPQYTETTRIITVPDSLDHRRKWLDSLSATIDTDDSLDISALLPLINKVKNKLKNCLPRRYILSNYPNPFNELTIIKYSLPEAGKVTLKIYNITGQEIATLLHKSQISGEYEVKWLAKGLPSGIYLCKLQSGLHSESRKIILLK